MANLSGVRAKLWRAAEHSYDFDRAFQGWIDTQPYGYTFERDDDPEWWSLRWRVREPPPASLALIFGDMLTNLRGALDYLVWQLVLAAKNQPTDRTMFPILRQTTNWASAAGDRLKGVDPHWVDIIESLQPYHRQDRPELHPLAVLDHVNNINKHRSLPASVMTLHQLRPSFIGDIGGRTMQAEAHIGAVEDGAIFFRVRFAPPMDHLDVDMYEDPALGISFADGLPHRAGFPDLLQAVCDVIAVFEPAFTS